MKVLNVHRRTIDAPKSSVIELLGQLATKEDRIWPSNKWPKMKFKDGLIEGAYGGHGPIRYIVKKCLPGKFILFEFKRPIGFNGCHKFEIFELSDSKTELVHTIDMNTSFIGTLKWVLAIRWLHDALIEDTFDNVENHFGLARAETKWSAWVKFLRFTLK